MKNTFLIGIGVLIVFITASCSGGKKTEKNTGTQVDKVQQKTVECNIPIPHPPEFILTRNHGQFYLGCKTNACVGCHQTMKSTQNNKCKECHEYYPHTENIHEHGTMFFNSQKECFNCHKVDKNHKATTSTNTVKACNFCHSTYPHNEDWLGNHGKRYIEWTQSKDKSLECAGCHVKLDIKHGIKKLKCDSCHLDPSHTTQFKDVDHMSMDISSCITCHDSNGEQLTPENRHLNKTCGTCHTPPEPETE